MRLSVASHKGKLSPASWAIRGPLLPPHHAGVGATKLPSRVCLLRRAATLDMIIFNRALVTNARTALLQATLIFPALSKYVLASGIC